MVGARRALLVAIAAVMLVAVLPGAAVAERTIGLSTGTFEFSVVAGKGGSGRVVVMNNGDENLSVLIYAANQKVDKSGAITYEVPNRDDQALQYNPASWIRLEIGKSTKALGNTPYIDMVPGEQVPVAFDLLVPEGTPPGDHQILLFFEMMSGAKPTEGEAASQVSGRVGARLAVRVKGEIVEKLEVRPFVTRGLVLGTSLPYTMVVRNGGNTDKPIRARIVVLDSNLNEIQSSDVATEAIVFAGSDAEYKGVLRTPRQLVGKYTMRLEVEYPREGSGVDIPETIKIDKAVWVLPLWLAIALVVMVGASLMWVSWRQTVRTAERRITRRREARPTMARERTAGNAADVRPRYRSLLDDQTDGPSIRGNLNDGSGGPASDADD